MKPKHTPGPWKISYEDKRIDVLAKDTRVTFIGNANTSTSKQDKAIADAQLIAAAPEMLKALHWMIDMVNGAYAGRRHGMAEKIAMLVTVEEIIAKAEGRKS